MQEEVGLSLAVSLIKKIDENNFCDYFERIYQDSFHIDKLEFWCEISGVNPNLVLKKIEQKGWKTIDQKVYLSKIITTFEELKFVFDKYKVSLKDIINNLVGKLEESHGDVSKALEKLPLNYSTLIILLGLQNDLVAVTLKYWVKKSFVPNKISEMSTLVYSKKLEYDEMILFTFFREKRPLKIEEIIYKSMGIISIPNILKNRVKFLLSILSIHNVKNSDYWILDEWNSKLNITLIEDITTLISDEGELSYDEIKERLPKYKKMEITRNLKFWPEFVTTLNDKYKLYFNEIDEKILMILKPFILKTLLNSKKGIYLNDLYKDISMLAISHSFNIYFREFKVFLRSWGSISIVGNKVYLFGKAPLQEMRLGDVAYLILKEKGFPLPYNELKEEVQKRRKYNSSISSVFLSEPKLSRPSRGHWALREWNLIEYDPDIHSRISEVLISIIEEANQPVHKSEIRSQLKQRGMNMNEGTLHLDLTENDNIDQVARGVYALKKWRLSFRDLFKYKFPFKLSLPDGNPIIYEFENGVMIEYFVTKNCLETGRILVKRHMTKYFNELKKYEKYNVTDFSESPYEAWVDKVDNERFQFLGLARWYKTHTPRYGDSIYLYIPNSDKKEFRVFTSTQADFLMYEANENL